MTGPDPKIPVLLEDQVKVSAGRGLSAREICDYILERLREFGGGAAWADDVTILVLRRPMA